MKNELSQNHVAYVCGIERNYSALLEGSSSRFANICEKLPSSHERQEGFKSKWVSGNLKKFSQFYSSMALVSLEVENFDASCKEYTEQKNKANMPNDNVR